MNPAMGSRQSGPLGAEAYSAAPGARVESDQIGAGTRVWAGAHVMAGARIGRDCNIGEHCFVEDGAVLGDGVVLKNLVSVWRGVVLQDHVFVGPAVAFTNDKFPRAHPSYRTGPAGWRETMVRAGASIGANATIMCGIEIGSWAVIGAGAVVTRDVPPRQLWLGNPARFAGYACACGRKLSEDMNCECGNRYALDGHALTPVFEAHDD